MTHDAKTNVFPYTAAMSMTLAQLAQTIEATVRGDQNHTVTSCTGLDDAESQHVSFLANQKYSGKLQDTNAGAVLVSAKDAESAPESLNLLVAADPYYAFRQAIVTLHGYREQPATGISEQAIVHPTATIGADVCIQPFAYVEGGATIGDRTVIYPHCYVAKDAVIGEDCVLYPNVTVYNKCVLGNRVILHSGCVIGQDGFGYATHQCEGEPLRHHKIPQIGNAVIHDDVELGANCAIDRATVGSTTVGAGTKFSDLVTIGHGATIGEHNLLVAQVGIAGSTETGSYVVMGGQVGVGGHLKIGSGVQLAGQAGVVGDLPAGQKSGGYPAQPWGTAKRNMLAYTKLADMAKDFKRLQRRVAELEQLQETPEKQ